MSMRKHGWWCAGLGGSLLFATVTVWVGAKAQDAPPAAPSVKLEARDPRVLAKLFREYDACHEAWTAASNREPAASQVAQLAKQLDELRQRIDREGGQRHCAASRLFWHTDLDEAQAAAQAQGKPILSLAMLGKLTDELSCANSRFFRTTLYSNQEISAFLRDHFILHWQSVRPVPVVTVDFGDGRKLVRTVTGNSAHYVLTPDGQVVDAIPGLYGPAAFMRQLQAAEGIANAVRNVPMKPRAKLIQTYHQQALAELQAAWARDLAQVGLAGLPTAATPLANRDLVAQATQPKAAPPARAAAAIAVPKGRVEMPLIATISNVPAVGDLKEDAAWAMIAALHEDSAQLDEASTALIAEQNPTAAEAAPLAITKRVVESPLVAMLRNLRSTIALDTVRNEYQLHRQIHEWFVEEPRRDLATLNERVYAELFLTPSSDPWLGLVPKGTYTALQNGGLVVEP